ncbi:hypothetical protein C0991_012423 [Blastosporella zonata]|nr:hypothetical protein C0991_012423 [Blastosporella zonata]
MSTWRNQSTKPMSRGRGMGSSRATSSAPPKRQMELIASVSRSSGLEKDGDTLKDFKVQEEYRTFLQGKVGMPYDRFSTGLISLVQLDDVLEKHPRRPTETEQEATSRVNAQENVLILFRKLREGISSSWRNDTFALEVYETSLYLAAVFESPKQTTAVIPHLLPSLYLTSSPPHKNRLITVLISLLHHLAITYPSQGTFRQFFDLIPTDFLPKSSAAHKWIRTLAKSLRTQNYATFEVLSRSASISRLFEGPEDPDLSGAMKPLSLSGRDSESLAHQALFTLVHLLRNKFPTPAISLQSNG